MEKSREREKEKVHVSQTPCTKQAPIPKRWMLQILFGCVALEEH